MNAHWNEIWLFLSVIALFVLFKEMAGAAREDLETAEREGVPASSGGVRALEPHRDPTVQSELDRIQQDEIPELLEKLPCNSWHKEMCYQKGSRWRYTFECNSESRRFFSTALGASPMEAFLIMRHRLLAQIRDWHETRFEPNGTSRHSADGEHAHAGGPRVLIVDDDVDMALAMQTAFGQLGCQTEVATTHEGLHRKLVSGGADYIFLDWRLNGQVTADQVVEKAVRYLDTFSDMRERFNGHRPQVVTHSVLDRDQVALPRAGDSYFNHLDHWQKPMPFHEVVKRASLLISQGPQKLEV